MDNKIIVPLTLGGKENLFIAEKEFYTTDVGPKLEFNVTGVSDFTNMTYNLTLAMADGSIYQHTSPVIGNPITYNIPDNEILHVGAVIGQVILNQAGEKVTFQEFVYKINLDLFSQATLDSLVSEVIVEDFDLLKTQVEGIHASVMANWDTIQATLNTMQSSYASDWSTWFTANTNSITAEWVALKAIVNADHATAQGDHTVALADNVTAVADHSTAVADHSTANTDHTVAGTDHGIAQTDHSTATADHSVANTDHNKAVNDNITAVADHNKAVTDTAQAGTDHTTAVADHGIAGTDHTTAQGDHSTVLTDHSTATADHSTAVTDHTTNLADHAIVGGYNTRLTTVEFDTVVSATNIVTNGDFSNGTTGWATTSGAISTANNILSITGNGTSLQITTTTPIGSIYINRKYRVGSKIRVTNSICAKLQIRLYDGVNYLRYNIDNPVQNQWYSISHIVTALNNTAAGRFEVITIYSNSASSIGQVTEVMNASAIDLTATFGAGKEPTLAEMDRLMARYPNSWFDGKQPLNIIRNLYTDKANKVQEAWITPTLLNGWKSVDSNRSIQYMKDEIGFVHLRGDLDPALKSSDFVLILPVGYRPSRTMFWNINQGYVAVTHLGQIQSAGITGWHTLHIISFRAEQ